MHQWKIKILLQIVLEASSASEMTYIVSSGALNSTHSLLRPGYSVRVLLHSCYLLLLLLSICWTVVVFSFMLVIHCML